MSPEEARRRFAAARVARLATISGAGEPHLVPLVFAVIGETVYSVVDQKPKRTRDLRRLENVHENNRAALLVDHYEEDWKRLWWVRADGAARIIKPSEPEAEEAIAALNERYPQQEAKGKVLALDVERWSGWQGGDAGTASG